MYIYVIYKERVFGKRKERNGTMEILTNENDWIPVSTAKYPQKRQLVHVTVDDGEEAECVIAYLEHDGRWYEDKSDTNLSYVTAWKPMQEIKPYKAEETSESEKESDNDGWIPCSVRYPEDGIPVQVTYQTIRSSLPHCDAFAYRAHGNWYWCEHGTGCGLQCKDDVIITAWKPVGKYYSN